MAKADDFDARIAAYFSGSMHSVQEIAFMQELDTNPALRKKFEDELKMGAILSGINIAGTQKGSGKLANSLYKNINKKTPVVLFSYRTRFVAAAVILIVAGVSATFLLTRKTGVPSPVIVKKTNAPHGTPIKAAAGQVTIANNAYNKYYTAYRSENGPMELGYYYNQYQKGNYGPVILAKPEDIQQMGTNNNQEELNQYLQFYKGLAYLAQNNAKEALGQFDLVLHASVKEAPQYYGAQWYSCLALLKAGQINNADSTANAIAKSKSPYKITAEELSKELSIR